MGLTQAMYVGSAMSASTIVNSSLSIIWMIGIIVAFASAQTTMSPSGGSPPANDPNAGATSLKVPNTLGTHDPSRVIYDSGSYYFYGTSGDVSGWYTTDNGATWKNTPSVFSTLPADVIAVVPQNNGHEVWAPDVIYNPNTNLFMIYYAVPSSNSGTHLHSATALVTSPTLNPATAKWKDMGPVVNSTRDVQDYSAIDPCPFFDLEGNMWLSFGSSYVGDHTHAINIVALDKMTGLRTDDVIHTVQQCACEASCVQPHNGYYYLFWNTGGCCNGASSTYTIHMARSTNVTGPYTGNTIFLSSTSTQHGPGQIGFITVGTTDYVTYHYYPNSGGSVLGLTEITWGTDGWPVAA